MTAALTKRETYKFGNAIMVSADLAFSSTYTTAGETLTVSQVGLSKITDIITQYAEDGSSQFYLVRWDGSKTSPKVKIGYGDNNNASDGPLIELPNGTSLTGLNARVFIFGTL